jgi:hypothetical protein
MNTDLEKAKRNAGSTVAKVLGNRRTRPTGRQSPEMRGIGEVLPSKLMQWTALGRR